MRACDCFCLGTAMGEGEYRSGDVVIRRMRRPRTPIASTTSPTACSATTARRAIRPSARRAPCCASRATSSSIPAVSGSPRSTARWWAARTRSCARGSGVSALRGRARAPGPGGRAAAARRRARVRRRGARRVDHVLRGPGGTASLRPGGLRPAPVRRGRRDAARRICPSWTPRSRAICARRAHLAGGARREPRRRPRRAARTPAPRSRAASPSTRRATSACSPRSTRTRPRGSCGRASRGRRAARRCRSTCSPQGRTGRSAPAWRPAWRSRRAARSSPGGTSGRCGRMSRPCLCGGRGLRGVMASRRLGV